MSNSVALAQGIDRLAGKTTCPHCWHSFRLDELLAIAQHTDLVGDTVAGDLAFRRFLPTRFTVEGHAMDARKSRFPR